MVRTGLIALGWLLGAGAVLLLAFVASFRTGFRPALDLVRRMNRRFINPRALRDAGQPGAEASVVHHVGRTSGRSYRTPVVARPVDDGFVIALPYGPGTDWVRNVMAAGGGAVEHDGRRVGVDSPRVVTAAEANHHFTDRDQRTHDLFGLDEFLHLHTASA